MTYDELIKYNPHIEQAYFLASYEAFQAAVMIAYTQGIQDGWEKAQGAALHRDMKILDDLEASLHGRKS